MWKQKLQTNKTNGTKSQTLPPFATNATNCSPKHSSPLLAATSSSPRTLTKLPSGVRYIRQTPSSIYRSVPPSSMASTPPKSQPSPTKKLRFADPLMSVKTDKTVYQRPSPTPKQSPSVRAQIVRPVFSQGSIDSKKSLTKSNDKTLEKAVALSPASRSRSPIFSTVDFGTNTERKSLVNTIASSGDCNSNANSSQLQTETMIEIKTANGTIKRSTVTTPSNNDKVHRNTLSFEHPLELANKNDQKRIAVNVNVAVGVDCNNKTPRKSSVNNTNNTNSIRLTNELHNDSNQTDEVDYSDSITSSLKVAVRLRPMIQTEFSSENDRVIDMKGNTVRIMNSDNENYNKLEFGFDVCLNSSDRDLFDYADQDTVYRQMGQPLLDRSLEGYNVCLFAYGQTGSGKSHTMMGSEAIPGIIPRFANDLFKKITSFNDIIITVEVSYFEIYNEKIYDLLSDDKTNYNKKILKVREHPQTGPYVEDLTIHIARTYEEVMAIMMSGKKRRATASTAANDESSRSHSIFTILLSQLKKSDDYLLDKSSSCTSKINLVDLAGSERVGNSGTSGERLKEGTLINKSLLTLGKVISQLAENGANNKSVYIPYRDSVLTWLLKESLGGNSRTSMIATISPAKCHLEETLSTLRYAAIARRIVNFVRINEDPKAKKIRELMEEIARLKQQQIINTNNNKTFSDKSSDTNKTPEIISKKTKTCSKTTETSFTFNEIPNQFDLMRTNLLEQQQRSLLSEIRKQRQNMFPDDIEEKSDSELLKQIYDLFEDVLNKSSFELDDTLDESTLIANTSNTSNSQNVCQID